MIPTALEHLAAIEQELAARDHYRNTLIAEDVRILRSMIVNAAVRLDDGIACAESLREEFQKQHKGFFERAVLNSLDNMRAARAALANA